MTSFCNNLLPFFFSLMNFIRNSSETSGPCAQWTVFQAAGAGYQGLRSFLCVLLLLAFFSYWGPGYNCHWCVWCFSVSPKPLQLFFILPVRFKGHWDSSSTEIAKWQKKMRVGQVEQIITSAVSSDPCVDRD